MSNWLVAVLFCVGLLAVVSWAVEKPTPLASVQPDDKGKDKKPDFRAGAVRYQVKDVDRSVEFYTKHLGFKRDQRFPGGGGLRRRLEREPYPLAQRPEEFGIPPVA